LREVLILIELINSLTDENWDYCLSGMRAKQYFKSGGCYEFVKVLKHFFPEGTIMMQKDYNHCAYLIGEIIYDCEGVCKKNDFIIASDLDKEKLEDVYIYGRADIKFDGKMPSEALIDEIYLCFPNQNFPFKKESVKK